MNFHSFLSFLLSLFSENIIWYLGHLPQELLETEIFDIIHPQDLDIIRESFEYLVVGEHVTTQPYRMKARNGDFVTLVSTWSCFVNPYNELYLEFIYGKHSVMRGPENPEIFQDPGEAPPFSDNHLEDLIKIYAMKEQIKLMVQQKVWTGLNWDKELLSDG